MGWPDGQWLGNRALELGGFLTFVLVSTLSKATWKLSSLTREREEGREGDRKGGRLDKEEIRRQGPRWLLCLGMAYAGTRPFSGGVTQTPWHEIQNCPILPRPQWCPGKPLPASQERTTHLFRRPRSQCWKKSPRCPHPRSQTIACHLPRT